MDTETVDQAPPQESVQQALRDIAIIRRCIEHSHGARDQGSSSEHSHRLKTWLHLALFALSTLILFVEVLSGGFNTQLLLVSRTDAELRYMGLMNLGLFLVVLSYLFYFIVSRTARDRSPSTDQFIARHFAYLSNLSLFTDLFLKFVMFSLLIYAGKPEWITSLLLLFIGDYLVQGRLFVFDLRLGLLLALVNTVGAFMCFFYQVSNLAVPLAAFVLTTVLSWAYLAFTSKRAQQSQIVQS